MTTLSGKAYGMEEDALGGAGGGGGASSGSLKVKSLEGKLKRSEGATCVHTFPWEQSQPESTILSECSS